jgi:serine/threonine protein kinase
MKNEENDEKLVVNEEDKEVDATSGKLKLITAIIYIAFIISIALVILGMVKFFFTETKDYKVYQKYGKTKTISESGNFKVYEGKDKDTNEIVFIKELQPTTNRTKENINEEARYIELFNKSSHSIDYIEKFEEDNIVFIVTKSWDGSLANYLDKSNGFNIDEIKIVMTQLNEVLSEMRKNYIVLNDINLENIYVKFKENTSKEFDIKLYDYENAKNLTNENATESEKNDLYHLGLTMYEMYFKNKNGNETEMTKNITDLSDNYFQDILNKTLVNNSTERISWDKYTDHAFFNITGITYDKVENIVKNKNN